MLFSHNRGTEWVSYGGDVALTLFPRSRFLKRRKWHAASKSSTSVCSDPESLVSHRLNAVSPGRGGLWEINTHRLFFNCLAVFGFIYLFCDVWSTRPAENTSALLRWPELIPSSGLLNWGLKTDVWFAEETETVCCYLKSLFCISKDEQMFFMRINDGVIFKKDDAGHRRPPQSVRSLVW